MPSYAEVHCKTNYSFLIGGSHPDELIDRAVELGYRALAVTDENSLAGVVRAYGAARRAGAQPADSSAAPRDPLKLIVGAELILGDSPPVVVWAADRQGYGNLAQLITAGRRRAPKGECWLRLDDLATYQAGLLAGAIPDVAGTPRPLPPGDPQHPSYDWYRQPRAYGMDVYRELFGDRGYMLAALYQGSDDALRLQQLADVSRRTGLPLVAAGDVLYHAPERMPLHDVLTAIKHRTTVAEAGALLQPNAQRHLRTIAERQRQFAAYPEALTRTIEIADRCQFCLSQLRYEYPEELAPPGRTPIAYLRELTGQGLARRYPHGLSDKVRRQVEHELQLIDELHYEAYFLTVWDLVRFARSRGILCQGRGSAANSAVCYALGITSVDPNTTELLFERFISRERNEAPDIDVDFEHERREEVLQYLYEKYGRERAGLAATVITYRTRSAVRDVGKALGLSLDRVDALAKQIDGYHHCSDLAERCRAVGIDPQSRLGRQLGALVEQLLGFPRHLSQHVGGMVIARDRLDRLVPIENAAMDGRTVIQWDKDDLEELGLLKVDCLCLGMLSAIRKCFEMIARHGGPPLTLASIPPDDVRVYDMICAADTVGVFQIESRGQMSMLPRLKPRCWYDLVIEVAIVRPGPIQGNMVHPYLRRRNGEEQVVYPNEAIKQVLHRTLGVPIFQEQAMKLAVVAAGFTPGEADQLRRAMGAWRKTGVIEKFRQKLMDGMRAKGLSDEFAEQVFRQIRGFGEYGFPESHAASFALLVYVSAWLKHYYPAAFTASILNSLPMGFYAPAQLVADARRHGVVVLPPDVNFSHWDCTLEQPEQPQPGCAPYPPRELRPGHPTPGEVIRRALGSAVETTAGLPTPHQPPCPGALRLGFRQITGLSQQAAAAIVAARQSDGPFVSIAQCAQRSGLGSAVIARLSAADAFASLSNNRRAALWQALGQESSHAARPLLDAQQDDDDAAALLPPLDLQQEVFADYRSVGLSLRAHPMSFHRRQLDAWRVLTASALVDHPENRQVRVAGLVILRQRPSTAKGITFVTLEDETGTINLVVKPQYWERHHAVCRTATAWLAHGKLEKRSRVIHVVVNRLEDLAAKLKHPAAPAISSRDFR